MGTDLIGGPKLIGLAGYDIFRDRQTRISESNDGYLQVRTPIAERLTAAGTRSWPVHLHGSIRAGMGLANPSTAAFPAPRRSKPPGPSPPPQRTLPPTNRRAPRADLTPQQPQFTAASEALRIRKSVTRAASSSSRPARGNIDGVIPRHCSCVKPFGSRGPWQTVQRW